MPSLDSQVKATANTLSIHSMPVVNLEEDHQLKVFLKLSLGSSDKSLSTQLSLPSPFIRLAATGRH